MGATMVNTILDKAQTILQDPDGTRWSKAELVGWVNSAYTEIVNARPDATAASQTFKCEAGITQVLTAQFPQALRLLEVDRNVASASTGAMVRLIERGVLTSQVRDWPTATPSDTVEFYMFDPKLPREFMVYPPATADAELEVVFSSVPENHDPANIPADETIKVPDSYANVILDYVLYRAYSKDAEYAANAQRAAAHFEAVQFALGTKAKTDTAVTPRDESPAKR